MVGVPRSKGCRNCRRKKKGCDLLRPACGQCSRLGYECSYDDKQWTFVGHNQLSFRQTPDASHDLNVGPSERRAKSASPSQMLERSLSRSAFRSATFEEFWQIWAPQDAPSTIYVGGVKTVPWTRTIVDLADFDANVKTALDAVALVIVGHSNSDRSLLHEGVRQYGRALSATNRALQDISSAQSDAVIACCKLLAMYENYRVNGEDGVSSQGSDWNYHVDGTCRIVKLRGPARHVISHGHVLFENIRMNAAILGITRRTPNFFTEHEWHTIPWQAAPRNMHAEMVDIMIALPELLWQQDRVSQQAQAIETLRDRFDVLTTAQDLIGRCIRTAESLRIWEAKALQASAKAYGEIEVDDEATLSTICKRHGFGFFNTCMQFWSTAVILYSTTWVIFRTVSRAAQPNESSAIPAWLQLPTIPSWMNPGPVATNIAINASHYFEDGAKYWGAGAAPFSLGVLCHYVAVTGRWFEPEMLDVREILRSARMGKITKEFLRSIANTASSAKGDPVKRDEHSRMAASWFGTDIVEESEAAEPQI